MSTPRNLNFAGAIGRGENPKGQTSQQPNGIERQTSGGMYADSTDLQRPPSGRAALLGNERKRLGTR